MGIVNNAVLAKVTKWAQDFRSADPFRHVVIDDFFDRSFCESLVREFPKFEHQYALNEMGIVGGKAVRVDVRDISDTYRQLDKYIQTDDFLKLISQITGISDLLYDTDYVGGGTHENVHGQGLDAHIDFNYHPATKWHRRLNLIVYLNPTWQESWGGALELHKDPWDTAHNRTKSVLPLFNRCVIFETNEISWHGFRRIVLPNDQQDTSRKSFAIYLYTRGRPDQETSSPHATVYVPDTMPDDIRAGISLTSEQELVLHQRFAHLRDHLKFLYDREKVFTAQITNLENALNDACAAFRVPMQGFAHQPIAPSGIWPDGWVSTTLQFCFTPTVEASELYLELWVPNQINGQQHLTFKVGHHMQEVSVIAGQRCSVTLPLASSAGKLAEVTIQASQTWTPSITNHSTDERALAWRLIEARLMHPTHPIPRRSKLRRWLKR
jgi:hypothetical protein